MKFNKVTVIESCVPGLQVEPGELVIWFDGEGRHAPIYLKLGGSGFVEWLPGRSIAECLRLYG